MRILFDLTSIKEHPTGIERVAYNAAKAYIKLDTEDEIILLFNNYIPDEIYEYQKKGKVKIVNVKYKKGQFVRLFGVPNAVKKIKADWNLFLAFPSPFLYCKKNVISIIHDLTPFTCIQSMKPYAFLLWRAYISCAVKNNTHILSVSNSVKAEINEVLHRNDVKCIYPGAVELPSVDNDILDRLNIQNGNFILSVSTIGKRKNLQYLINAYDDLINENIIDDKLVLTGKYDLKIEDLLNGISKKTREKIVFSGYVTDGELKTLYENTSLFTLPSIYEGFGLPVIEATLCKAPILISDIPIFREITENNAVYFSLNNVEDYKNKISEMIQCNEYVDNLYSVAQKYTWNNYAVELRKFLLNDYKRK